MLGGDEARDMGAVSGAVVGVGVVVAEIELVDDAIGHAVQIRVGTEEGMVQIGPGVNDRDAHSLPRELGETRISAHVG